MLLSNKLSKLLNEKHKNEDFSGVVLLGQNDKILFEGVYGFANRSWKIENRLDTRFRIASISKLFTAVAILQLIEQGKLSLDTGAVEYLVLEATKIPESVTVYHLLTMTSGIADWFDESGDWEANWAALLREHPIYLLRSNADYLPLFVNDTPLAAVGEKYHYNGAGYILLGLMIEKASGLSYFDYVRQHIFVRAGMCNSDFLALDGVYNNVAGGYIPLTNAADETIGWKTNVYATTPEAAADGGASSTAEDLLRFLQALRNGRLLSAEMTHEILTPKVTQETTFRGYLWQYGFGNMFISNQNEQIMRYGHTGEEDGVSCRLYCYLRQGLDVVILSNQSWRAGELGWEIHDLITAKE